MTVLICLLLSSLSVFTMSQIDSKGRRVYPFVFFPHKMHFKCFALSQMLCNHSFKDVQPTIFSPDNCADMKIEGASLLFWITSWRPANPNRFYLGVRFFLVLLPRQLHAQLKTKHAEVLNLLAIPNLLMMSNWAVPHQGDIIYYRGWHQWKTIVCCQGSLLGQRRTKLFSPSLWNPCVTLTKPLLSLTWHHGT